MNPRPVVAAIDGEPKKVVAGSQPKSVTIDPTRSVTMWVKPRAAALKSTANSVSDMRCCAQMGSGPSICSMTSRAAPQNDSVVGLGL